MVTSARSNFCSPVVTHSILLEKTRGYHFRPLSCVCFSDVLGALFGLVVSLAYELQLKGLK